jgi:hypothetical protein
VNPYGANHPHATHKHDHASVGRGGAGNIDVERSRSRDPADGERRAAHGLAGFVHRATHLGSQKDDVQSEVITTA